LVGLSSKHSEGMAAEITENYKFLTPPMSFEAPCHGTPTNIRINLIPPESRVHMGYIFAGDSMGLFSNFRGVYKRRMIGIAECVMTVQGHPRSTIFMSVERTYVTSYY